MKQTINIHQFRTAFKQIRPENFSYEGLQVLFEYLEEYEDATGEEIELDVIELCCTFSEIPLSDLVGEEEGLLGEFIGRTDHSVIVLND